jgi:glyoxylase-like metal-dependent hydrolase (beta-lactamase superfamily II)
MPATYRKGLHELGDGLFAYLQPDGTWGWSNAGLVTADGASLLVDTLFDLSLTREMLDAMRPVTDRQPIDAALNTHGNGDHCFGNQLLPASAEIYATAAAVADMQAAPPQLLDPAHTQGDAIAHVPDAGVVFTGDILFVEGTPIVWAGPFSNWLEACDRILALGARTLVPGHGPITDASGVREVKRYLAYVHDEARARFQAGMGATAAADDIDLSDFADWGDPERIAVNVETVYRELDPGRAPATPPELFARMAGWARRHGG